MKSTFRRDVIIILNYSRSRQNKVLCVLFDAYSDYWSTWWLINRNLTYSIYTIQVCVLCWKKTNFFVCLMFVVIVLGCFFLICRLLLMCFVIHTRFINKCTGIKYETMITISLLLLNLWIEFRIRVLIIMIIAHTNYSHFQKPPNNS